MKNVGVLVGSLRKDSYSGKVAKALEDDLEGKVRVHVLKIGDLPIYNQDYDDEGAVPEEWVRFRAEVGKMDAFLFVTPEYNRSVPAVLKNALDVASRPYGQNKWSGKPGAVVSVSPGQMGGFGANNHLRQSLTFLNVYTMQQPEAYIGHFVIEWEKDDGVKTKKFLKKIAESFLEVVNRLAQE